MEDKPVGPKSEKQAFRKHLRERQQQDWLASAGSAEEKRLLKNWVKHGALSACEKADIAALIRNPHDDALRNTVFWNSAKESLLGTPIYKTAIERHQSLNDAEWLVACFTARGKRQKEIAALTGLSERMIDNIIRSLKDKIMQELGCDIEGVELVQIAHWFFGH